jgi:squalene-hopene/tetraprenyl-beta-curcumene cyclase
MNPSTPNTATATVNDLFRTAEMSGLDAAIERGRAALLARQHKDGHWCFELESDATITAEYILMMHFMDEIDDVLQEKMARYLRDK